MMTFGLFATHRACDSQRGASYNVRVFGTATLNDFVFLSRRTWRRLLCVSRDPLVRKRTELCPPEPWIVSAMLQAGYADPFSQDCRNYLRRDLYRFPPVSGAHNRKLESGHQNLRDCRPVFLDGRCPTPSREESPDDLVVRSFTITLAQRLNCRSS